LSMQFVDNDSLLHNANVDKRCTQLKKMLYIFSNIIKIQQQKVYFLEFTSGLFMSCKSGWKKFDSAQAWLTKRQCSDKLKIKWKF